MKLYADNDYIPNSSLDVIYEVAGMAKSAGSTPRAYYLAKIEAAQEEFCNERSGGARNY